ncbi:MAG: SDR family NAD(P)-dependent oxidoreductase [Pseudomonadota bacterium]
MNIEDTRAVITGGVSGLGLAVARHFVAKGAKVTLLDINDEAGAAAEAEFGAAAKYIKTDVTSESAVTEAMAKAVEFMGGINVAVNCAGVIGAGRVLGREGPMDLDFFAKVIQINLVGSFNASKAAAAAMEANESNADGERGVIINTAAWPICPS